MAATTRTSTRRDASSPTRRTSPSCSARSSLTWSGDGQLAELVEEERAAIGLCEEARRGRAVAPVNAPFAWPNSSLSSSVSGMAPQFTAMNGPRGARALPMDVARHELLARAALPGDRAPWMDGARPCQRGSSAAASCGLRPTMPVGRAERGQLMVQLRHFAPQSFALDRLAQHEQHLVGAKWLGDEVVRAARMASTAASSSP